MANIGWPAEYDAGGNPVSPVCDYCQKRPADCDCQVDPGWPYCQGCPDVVPDSRQAVPDSPAFKFERGGCILDTPSVPEAVWGDGPEVLWAAGQALVVAGPDGTGKTTLAGNLIHARLGLGGGTVLGQPVKPGERNVLCLLMDRPTQAKAALARLFTESDRDLLDQRLFIWPGPPPVDLARDTDMLARLCASADADTCIVDSLKDAALKLSDDETGAGWNRARQNAVMAGVQLLELHHPRKATEGNKKPHKLDDLYGSRWIPAGAGSVISLWGEAGDPVVELSHLKPPVECVGPWNMAIDGTTGTVSIEHGIDLLEQTRFRGSEGMTAAVAANLLYGTNTKAACGKATRRLDALVTKGLLHKREGSRGGKHGSNPAAWFLVANTNPNTAIHGG